MPGSSIGAIYLENGYAYTRRFIVIRSCVSFYITNWSSWMTTSKVSCSNGVRKTAGDQLRTYSKYKSDNVTDSGSQVVVEGQSIAEADDYNKKNAEQIASEKAMLKMGILISKTLKSPFYEPARL